MKKLIYLFCILFSNTAFAVLELPQNMNDWEGFYFEMYDDTYSETQLEVLHRVMEHKWIQDLEVSIDDINEIKDLNVASEYEISEGFSDVKHENFAVNLKRTYKEEQDFLIYENLLRRKTRFLSAFANNAEYDAPFDVITDLNRIDFILFGESADFVEENDKPYTSFSKVKYQENKNYQSQSFDDTIEDWQDESPKESKELSAKNDAEGPEGDCIGQHIADLVPPLENLKDMPLKSRCDTKSVLESPFLKECSKTPKIIPNTTLAPKPFDAPEDPEVYTVQTQNFYQKFNADIISILFEEKFKFNNEIFDTASHVQEQELIDEARQEALNDANLERKWKSEMEIETEQRSRVQEEYDKLLSDFKVFFEEVERWNDYSFKSLLNHPIHP